MKDKVKLRNCGCQIRNWFSCVLISPLTETEKERKYMIFPQLYAIKADYSGKSYRRRRSWLISTPLKCSLHRCAQTRKKRDNCVSIFNIASFPHAHIILKTSIKRIPRGLNLYGYYQCIKKAFDKKMTDEDVNAFKAFSIYAA